MTEQEAEEYIQDTIAYHEELRKIPGAVRKFLVETGIYDEEGNLKEPYK